MAASSLLYPYVLLAQNRKSALLLTPFVEKRILESRPTLNAAAAYPPTSYNQFTGAPPAATWPSLPFGEMKTYRDLFKSLDKENGILQYDTALQILLKSGVPTATLAKIL